MMKLCVRNTVIFQVYGIGGKAAPCSATGRIILSSNRFDIYIFFKFMMLSDIDVLPYRGRKPDPKYLSSGLLIC